MKNSQTKPAVIAGFFIFVSIFIAVVNASAQDFIDVEAERESAAAAGLPTSTVRPGVQPAVQGGVKPYSGLTTTVVPIETDANDTTTPINAGALVIQVQQLQEEVRRLNGLVEEQTSQIRRLKEQSLERYIDLDRRLAELANVKAPEIITGDTSGLTFGGVNTPNPSNNTDIPMRPVAEPLVADPAEESAYQGAYSYVKVRNFAGAVGAFQNFLGRYPLGAYAPNAHYWLGELYLVVEPPEPELARQNFKLLLDQYPENAKVPDALYKLGKVHFLKGNRERSREYLDQVIRQYSGHPAAQLARDFLDENF
ncbi:MAG: tol-pal system protein YbgF [Luminiphilus sp.]|nr:tol-pal system protein YbgF [Luminiphilus sp.]